MLYFIIYIILYPLLKLISFFRGKPEGNLIIQSAKIGDYVNTSILLPPLGKSDLIIRRINGAFAEFDPNVENIFYYDDVKKNKISTIINIYLRNYKNVIVVLPNSYNLFLAKLSFAPSINTINHYAVKWYEKLLMIGMRKIDHTIDDLTLSTYLKLINETDVTKHWKSIPTITPEDNSLELITNPKKFKVGISLTAGNKLKTIDPNTWEEIFKILSKYDLEFYIFGLESEQKYLDDVRQFIEESKMHSLLGKIPLKHLSYFISKMDLYISSDTGNSYIADSLRVPTINFAGPCYINEQKPIYEKSLIINSNHPEAPFTYIFKTVIKNHLQPELFKINNKQKDEIDNFIAQLIKEK
jgi:ADP-heptose:LPS heptosyltransferase